MPEEDYEFTSSDRLMRPDEIESIARVFVEMGVTKIRLTGGEPLVRKDAAEIIHRLAALPVELTLTTNGTRLHSFVDILEGAKVKSLNVSLDTLDPEKFLLITRRNQFQLVKDNISMVLEKGFQVKVNVVVIKGINDNEINDFVQWTKDEPLYVRFIEFMPFEGNRWSSNKVVTEQEILSEVNKVYSFNPLPRDKHDTAKKFQVAGHKGTFGIISTMSSHFCNSCNRIRLTADGKIKNCLFSKEETDLLSILRSGGNIINLIQENMLRKSKELGGQFGHDFKQIKPGQLENRSMIGIGG